MDLSQIFFIIYYLLHYIIYFNRDFNHNDLNQTILQDIIKCMSFYLHYNSIILWPIAFAAFH